MSKLLQQLKSRRLDLGLKQGDMLLRAGVSRQQYQRLESKGNPRLDTLELLAQGLSSELMLIPKERLALVQAVLADPDPDTVLRRLEEPDLGRPRVSDDPWRGLLDDSLDDPEL